MAATVQTFVDLLNTKLHGYQFSQPQGNDDKIRQLNAAKHKVWLALVAAGRAGGGNWFIKKATLNASGLDNALPADFHDLAFIECTTGGWTGVQVKALDFMTMVFQEQRRNANALTPQDTIYYVVSGATPAQISFARLGAGTAFNIFYTYFLGDWTALSDDASMIPPPYVDMVCNYAAAAINANVQDAAMEALWRGRWDEDKGFVAAVSNKRQIADNVAARSYDRSG